MRPLGTNRADPMATKLHKQNNGRYRWPYSDMEIGEIVEIPADEKELLTMAKNYLNKVSDRFPEREYRRKMALVGDFIATHQVPGRINDERAVGRSAEGLGQQPGSGA